MTSIRCMTKIYDPGSTMFNHADDLETGIINMRCIRLQEQMCVRELRCLRLKSGRAASVAGVFRQCGW